MESPTLALEASRASHARRPTLFARALLRRLARIESGSLSLTESGRTHRFGDGDPTAPSARIEVHDERFFGSVLGRGTVGAAEAYARGWWTCDDPIAVTRIMARNDRALQDVEGGLARLCAPLLRLHHALRRNTERGSRANIAAHYDLSNEFFALFLDDTLTYSCGIFERADASLRNASIAKIDRICRRLRLASGDRVLEIGTGWGAFAIHAAREYGCHVTTTTISREQRALAAERIRSAGLSDRIVLLGEDYRRLTGTFDKLVSIEMIEAVGHQFYDEFFRRAAARLVPGGSMCLQAITIADQHYERAKDAVDFIQRHVFPGSCIPSVTALCNAATRASDLRLVGLEDIGLHYVTTLQAWRRNLAERWADARALGFSDEFLRMWDFYFCYCAGGFAERRISTAHMLFERAPDRLVAAP